MTCSVEECENTAATRGWCNGHYKRWLRTGSLGSKPINQRRTDCSVEGCNRGHFGRGYCQTHLYRLRTNGDPNLTRPPGSPAGETHHSHRGDAVSYTAVHRRLRVYYGRAAEQNCISCGSGAAHWAYQHTAPDERICDVANLPYTTDLTHYRPMCASCHHQMDTLYGWHQSEGSRGVSYVKRHDLWRAYATLNGRQHTAGMHKTKAGALEAVTALRTSLLDEWQRHG